MIFLESVSLLYTQAVEEMIIGLILKLIAILYASPRAARKSRRKAKKGRGTVRIIPRGNILTDTWLIHIS
jgi:uncharacterized membrane-anchored protein